MPFVLAAGCILAATHGGDLDWAAPSPEAALAEILGRRGLSCEAADVTWIDPPSGIGGAIAGRSRALVRANAAGEPSDLYLVEGRLSPEGSVLWVGDLWDVTNTSGADESRPILRGSMAAYSTSADGMFTGVHVLDLAGPPASAEADFTRVQHLQTALTNLQQTGQARGIAHTAFALDPMAGRLALAWAPEARPKAGRHPEGASDEVRPKAGRHPEGASDDETDASHDLLEAQADTRRLVLDPHEARAVEGADFVRVVPDERARPGNLVTWAVDRVRALSWFGDDRMQWVKAVAFTALDKVRATFSRAATAEDVREEIGLSATTNAPPPTFTDPEVGWPPLPIPPVFASPLPGEGQWIALDRDPFITPTPARTAPAFVTSFVRPDRQRADLRVYVTLWDPRQVALHMEAGTVEPISATGEHGSGMIPRVPEVMEHVVAAFNGGFQAQHGEYGMQANGIEYLPPKPYGATVVELRDGSNGFGAWPASVGSVPSDVIGMRQNLTALVQNGRFNPWGRTWWGGAPPGWPDQIHTARSGICLTREGFAGYFYSSSISAEDLALAMLAARCSFGIHLDMNVGHAGFEFYDVAPEGQLAPMARPLQGDWEAQGKVPDMPGYVFRGRRMIRGMGHMLFPRYIQREARDFFYLTSRSILPGAPVSLPASSAPADADEGKWRTHGLPQHGFPFAVATSWLRAPAASAGAAPDGKIRVVRADPRAMRPARPAHGGGQDDPPDDAPPVLSLVSVGGALRAARTLWWRDGLFAIEASPSTPSGAEALLGGCAVTDPCASTAHAAVGVQDEDGMLLWAELPPETRPDAASAAALDAVLARQGCATRMMVPGRAQAFLGGGTSALDLAGDPAPRLAEPAEPARPAGPAGLLAPTARWVRMVRATAPDAHPVFTDTPIVPIQVWQPLQMKRVRYFPKPTAPSPAP